MDEIFCKRFSTVKILIFQKISLHIISRAKIFRMFANIFSDPQTEVNLGPQLTKSCCENLLELQIYRTFEFG